MKFKDVGIPDRLNVLLDDMPRTTSCLLDTDTRLNILKMEELLISYTKLPDEVLLEREKEVRALKKRNPTISLNLSVLYDEISKRRLEIKNGT